MNDMNEVYERDYTLPESEMSTEPITFFDKDDNELGMIQMYKLYAKTVPKHIVPEDKANYEYLLQRCDEMAAAHYGQLYGIVDYETYGAKIQLTLPSFIEFCDDNDLLFLKEVAEKARTVRFEPAADSIVMNIFINYFDEDESFVDFYASNIKKAIENRGLTLEEVAEQCDVDLEDLKEALGEYAVIKE